MKVYVVDTAAPEPSRPLGSGNVLLLSPLTEAKGIIFKVKNWDPTLHPKGYKGLFISTPDKHKAGESKHGDVIATKGGKVFKVEKLTAKGVKVNPVNPDTGEIKTSYTVLGHDIDVAKIEGGKGVGSKHPIGTLDPGTYIQHPKTGNKFQISKHGKWTTVYPVDDHGNVKGKHTVLPQDMVVQVDAPTSKDGLPTAADKGALEALGNSIPEPKQITDEEVIQSEEFQRALHGTIWKLMPLVYQSGFEDKEVFINNGLEELTFDSYDEFTGRAMEWNIDPMFAGQYWHQEFTKRKKAMQEAANAQMAKPVQAAPNMPKPDPNKAIKQGIYDWLAEVGMPESFKEDMKAAIDGKLDMKAAGYDVNTTPQTPEEAWKLMDAAFDFNNGISMVEDDLEAAQVGEPTWKDMFDGAMQIPWAQYQEDLAKYEAATSVKPKSQQIEEILPTKLPKPPKMYPAGATQHGTIVIQRSLNKAFMQDEMGTTYSNNWYTVKRRMPDGTERVLLTTHSGGTAISHARNSSAPSEGIIYEHVGLDSTKMAAYQAELRANPVNKVIVGINEYGGDPLSVTSISTVTKTRWDGKQYEETRIQGTRLDSGKPFDRAWAASQYVEVDESVIQSIIDNPATTVKVMPHEIARALANRGLLSIELQSEARKPHPEKWVPELQNDWSFEQLHGKPWAEAHKSITALGYREIKPRQKGIVRYIDAKNRRLTVERASDGTVTDIAAPKLAFGKIEGQTTAREMHDMLQEALATGADLEPLDPRNASKGELKTAHVQQVIYDLALGKRNGVEKVVGGGAKIKSDAEYRTEIEEEGKLPSVESFLPQAESAPMEFKARGSIIEHLGLQDDPDWDFPNRRFKVPEGLSPTEEGALYAILNNQGTADQILNESHTQDITPTFDPKLDPMSIARLEPGDTVWYRDGESGEWLDTPDSVATVKKDEDGNTVSFTFVGHDTYGTYSQMDGVLPFDPKTAKVIEGAKLLAKAWNDQSLTNTKMDEASRQYVAKTLMTGIEQATATAETYQNGKLAVAGNLRDQAVQDEVDKRRAAEGTVKESTAEFDLPTWSNLHMESQTWDDIGQHVNALKPIGQHGGHLDVPAFYQGGYFKDGMLLHRADQTEGKVLLEFDDQVTEVLGQLGAESTHNPHPINPGYSGSSSMYDGEAWVYQEQGASQPYEFTSEGMTEATETRFRRALDEHTSTSAVSANDHVIAMNAIAKSYPADEVREQTWTFLKNIYGEDAAQRVWVALNYTPGVTIEYVSHKQPAQGAPTSQRGRLSVYGLSPQDAHRKLMELGLIAELEPEVPFQQVMGSKRRAGLPAPVHPAYLRGEADLPKTPARISHGLTGDAATEGLLDIMNSGGLMSIEQRHRMGILAKIPTTSSAGDIRSGIDHAVFGTLGVGGACGGGSPVKIIMKPSAFLRRDIVMSPTDYGAAATRYQSYRKYLNGLQALVGEQETSLYEPISPKARQQHFDTVHLGGSNEFNVGPSLMVEDWEHVVVPPASVDAVNLALDHLMSIGQITSRPQVHGDSGTSGLGGVASSLGNVKTKGTKLT